MSEQVTRSPESRLRSASAVILSLLVIIPCFWHTHLEAGDLGSHTYNAWLAELVKQGRAPGLVLHAQSFNILFDSLLSISCKLLGFAIGEKIAAAVAVLIFFWGTYSFVAVHTQARSYVTAALLAVATYGWTFQAGLMNFYISIGLMFGALAILRSRISRKPLWLILLLAFMWLSHPLGIIGFAVIALFGLIFDRLKTSHTFGLLAAAIAILYGIRLWLASHFPLRFSSEPLQMRTGIDQLMLYSMEYRYLGLLALILGIAGVVRIVANRKALESDRQRQILLIAELYVVIFAGVCLLPDILVLNKEVGPFSLLTARTTTLLAVLALVLLSQIERARWERFAWTAVAVAFFAMLYHDTGILSDMESQAFECVKLLPENARVTTTFFPRADSRLQHVHIFDRACIGRCFVVDNYEPVMKQFRVRAIASTPVVETDPVNIDAMQVGRYVVHPEDLPLYAMHQCNAREMEKICVGPLQAGEYNGFPSQQLNRR